ncbi:hypothetical protein FH972_010376 [Carpinus fangiana]|uniref:DUF506 domain-containing protein n=1 Tax=Carpinus fangiana TaxID=176857 RepID=A0A660KQ16_9ROSI|nr:hypothetical protein FH972_010376 [Carpinus fangiana]
MAGLGRTTKRVTDPLNDKVRDRLVGKDQTQLSYVSSGSEHSPDDSPCLAELVHGFLENDCQTDCHADDMDSKRVDSAAVLPGEVEDILRSTAGDNAVDSYMNMLVGHVSQAAERFSCLPRSNRNVFRRNVMAYLREVGHNAAICKTRWESSGGLTAGNYEFIDVVQPEFSTWHPTRYIVEFDFAAQFEIARPTEQYTKLLRSLPRVFVGRSEALKKVVKVMCNVAKRTLRSRDLSVPPWRKNRYMQNKWFGPYRRTTNLVPENVGGGKCKFVGFDDAVSVVNVSHRGFFVRTR